MTLGRLIPNKYLHRKVEVAWLPSTERTIFTCTFCCCFARKFLVALSRTLSMGILDFFRRSKPSPREAAILMLGLDNAGKTSILKKMSDEEITNIMPTQGFNIKSITQQGFKLNVWDIGGQRAIRPYWRHYFDKSDVLIYVVDSADKRRLEEAGAEFEQLLEEDKLAGVPLLVFANKQDLVGALTDSAVAEALRLHNLRDRAWRVQPCSAKTGSGLGEGIQWMLEVLCKK